jgi:hypothetical protein
MHDCDLDFCLASLKSDRTVLAKKMTVCSLLKVYHQTIMKEWDGSSYRVLLRPEIRGKTPEDVIRNLRMLFCLFFLPFQAQRFRWMFSSPTRSISDFLKTKTKLLLGDFFIWRIHENLWRRTGLEMN